MRVLVPSFALLLTFAPPALAQRQQSAAGRALADYDAFVGLDLRFGDVMDDFGAFVGGHAALLLKNRVYVGVRGVGLATDNARFAPNPQAPPEPIRMGYGGILLGYVVPSSSLVHVTADVLLGAGAVDANRDDERPDGDDASDAVFVFEPSVTVEVKLTRFTRIGVGAGYRFIGDVDLPGVQDDDLRGVTGVVTIRMGKF